MINWNGSTAGNCTNAVQYIAEIITVTKRMVLNVTGNNSLQLCNTTEVIAVSIGASYKGRHGEKSKFYLLERCSRDVLSNTCIFCYNALYIFNAKTFSNKIVL